jgi:histone H3/H4
MGWTLRVMYSMVINKAALEQKSLIVIATASALADCKRRRTVQAPEDISTFQQLTIER